LQRYNQQNYHLAAALIARYSLTIMPESYTRFRDISVSERILNTVFLLTVGLGYLVPWAIYYTHQGRDGVAGLSIADVTINYHGSNDQTRLGSAINGIMEPNLKYKNDKKSLQNGYKTRRRTRLRAENRPILNRDCIKCHTLAINPSCPI